MGVQINLPGPKVGERDGLAVARDLAKALHPGRFAREEHHPRLVLAGRDVLNRYLLDDRRLDSVDETRSRRGACDLTHVSLREVQRCRAAVAAGFSAASASDIPRAATTSSVGPSAWTAAERMVWLIVSPVASAAVMIAVPSMSPSTIRALRPRPAASIADAEPEEDPVAEREHGDRAQRRREHGDRARRPVNRPGCQTTCPCVSSSGAATHRCVGERDLVGLPTGRRAEHRHELRDLPA